MPRQETQFEKAQECLQRGDADGALRLIEPILRRTPAHPQALWIQGMARLTLGDTVGAAASLERALLPDPRNGLVLDGLGLAYLMLGRYADAASVLRRAAALPRAPAIIFMRLGMALLNLDQLPEALEHLRQAAQLEPRDPSIRVNLGQARYRSGDIAGARSEFELVLQQHPSDADALFNLGVIDLEQGDLAAATLWFERATRAAPQHAEAWVNLGVVREREQNFQVALDCHRRALAAAPGMPAAASGCGRALAMLGQQNEAREQFLAALRAAPDDLAAHEGLYLSCLALGRSSEALPHLQFVVTAEPQNIPALQALASTLFELGQLDEAQSTASRWLALAPDATGACMLCANLLLMREQWHEAITLLQRTYDRTRDCELLGMLTNQYRQICDWPRWQVAWAELKPLLDTDAALGSPFWLLCEPITAQQQLAYTRRWAAARFGATPAAQPNITRPLVQGHRLRRVRRIRIGYLSSDFQEHAAAYLVADLLERHDRSQFEIFAYSYGPQDDSPMRQRIVRAVEHFIDIAWDPDDIAAARIRRDEIDVLIELKGYTVGDRVSIMAHRPCDIQVTWLGYPGTTGAPFVDYLIADPIIIRDGEENTCAEKVLRLPHCYQPNDRKREIAQPLTRAAYGLPEQGFIFCCFNQTYKITPEVFAVWMQLLKRVPGSVLWLVESNAPAKQNLAAAAEEQGVAANRLVFAPRLPYAQHLARYRVADLALDTWPYTSHTTLSDGLWCGSVAVGLTGDTFAARVSGSILTAANLADLVTHNLQDYEALAFRLSSDAAVLHSYRERLAQARDSAPLFDTPAFARSLEGLYREITTR
jgi:predicted O-linked N-acetylglucosamine transferase (SPINDLY family)